MYAPYVKYSDDQTSQLAQGQIFLNLVVSVALRLGPSEALGVLVTVSSFLGRAHAHGTLIPIPSALVLVWCWWCPGVFLLCTDIRVGHGDTDC